MIENQKITKNKISQIKEQLFSIIANQLKLQGKIELLQNQNAELKRQAVQVTKPTYAHMLGSTPSAGTKTLQIQKNKDKAKHTLFIKSKGGEKTKAFQQESLKRLTR